MSTRGSSTSDDVAVLSEAKSLLTGIRFDTVGGAVVNSDGLFISLVPSWEDDDRSHCTVRLLCRATWHSGVDWSALRVMAAPKEGSSVMHLLPLSADGCVTFEGLAPGTYRLRAFLDRVQFPVPGAYESTPATPRFALRGGAVRGPTTPTVGDDDESQSFARTEKPDSERIEILAIGQSRAGDVVHAIRRQGSDAILQFYSNAEHLEGRSVEYSVTWSESTRVLCEGTVTLGASGSGDFRYVTEPVRLDSDALKEIEDGSSQLDVSYSYSGP